MHHAKCLFVAVLCLLFPQGSTAAPSVVQSGEHDGFARLVASIPLGVTWRAEKKGQMVLLHLDGHRDGFETGKVFDKIARNRVGALSQTSETLSLTLTCNCKVAVFAVGAEYVALDILSEGVSSDIAFLKDTEAQPVIADAPVPSSDVNTGKATPVLSVTLPVPETTSGPEIELPRKALNVKERVLLTDIHQQLIRELGGAATRGILEQSNGLPQHGNEKPQVDLSFFDAHMPPPRTLPTQLPEDIRNIRITSSMDIQGSDAAAQESLSSTGLLCPKDNDIDVANWGGEAAFHTQVGSARENLYGEFDRLDVDIALKLAKTYIHFGFGAEARQVLTLDPELAKKQPLLLAMADIMERGVATDLPSLRSLIECKSDVALWAILAKHDLVLAGAVNSSAALLALNKLPPHLRSFLAPALSRRLLSHGDTTAAATALRSLERLPDAMSPAGKLAQAEVSFEKGQIEKGKAQLADVIDDNAAQTPEALIALVDVQLKANKPISLETAGLIEAYAQELQETDLGPELRRAHVLALLKSGQFDQAFEATKDLGGNADDNASVELRLQMMHELTVAAEDVVFLDHMFRQDDADVAKLPVASQLSLAERYLMLGFGHDAQTVVDMVPDQPSNPARQILAARIALAMERPALAQASLLGLENDEATLLRANAKTKSGAHEEAYRLYEQANEPETAARTAWLAEEWQSLTNEDTPLFGPVAALASYPIAVDSAFDGMLARTNTALQESGRAREVLSEMLRTPALQLSGTLPAE